MSRFTKFVIVLGIFVFFLPPLISAYYYGVKGYAATDSLCSALLGWATETEWADRYSERSFARITVGMTQVEVRRIMGEPVWVPTSNYWGYSWSPTSTHYHQRAVVFSDSGRVEEIVKGFYLD